MAFYTPGTTNLCTNGGFETNTTGWTAYTTGAIARVTTQANFGSASLEVTCPANLDGAYFTFSYTNGTQYTISVWALIPSGVSARMATSAGSSTVVAGDGTFKRLTVSFTAAVGENALYIQRSGGTGTVILYVDGVQIEAQPFATPYVETNGATASRRGGKFGSGHFYAPLTGR